MPAGRRRLFAGIGIASIAAIAIGLYAFGAWRYLNRDTGSLPGVTPTPGQQAQSYERLRSAAQGPLELAIEGGFPRGVIGEIPVDGKSPVEIARNYLEQYQDFYLQRDPNLELHLLRSAGDSVVFYQTYQGVRVYGGELMVMTGDGGVLGTSGMLLPSGTEVDVTPGLSAAAATATVVERLQLEDAQQMGKPRLVIFDPGIAGTDGDQTALSWRIRFNTPRDLEVVVNASSGEIVHYYHLENQHFFGYNLKIYNAAGQNASDSDCFSNNTPIQVGNLLGIFNAELAHQDGQAAYDLALSTYLYFHDTHGLHSYDGIGGPLEIYFWSSVDTVAVYMTTCGGFLEFAEGAVVPDIFTHEFTHAVNAHHAGLKYYDQSGALSESFADVMGAMVDFNWTVGEQYPDGPFRDMSNPNAYGDPGHMSELMTILDCANEDNPLENDNGCVHSNSGIPNLVAYLLAHGGTHPDTQVTVSPLGYSQTGWLSFQVFTSGLTSNAQFVDARFVSVLQALAAWGNEGACRVRNAWFSAGVGNPDLDCDGQVESGVDSDGDLVPDAIDNCQSVFNPLQLDQDLDGFGDLCDLPDLDLDNNGIPDAQETQLADPFNLCPTPGVPCNPEDYDADGIPNADDNCMFTKNQDQADVDKDGQGDACDPDSDGDGISDNDDNCIYTPNADQANADGDLAGDVCDPNPTCDDVYAWSAGSTIQLGDEVIEVPPEPIADPFACPPNAFLDGESWVDQKPQIEPGGDPERIQIVRGDDPVTVIPIPVCQPDSPAGSPSMILQVVQLDAEQEPPHAWIMNDLGVIVSKDRDPGPAGSLPFVPRGGDSYYLVLNQAQQGEGANVNFDLLIECEPKEPQERVPPPPLGEAPRPSGSSPTATPSPSASASLAPTATPSATSAPVYTPTETPRPSPTPRATDTPRATATPSRADPTATPTPTSDGRG